MLRFHSAAEYVLLLLLIGIVLMPASSVSKGGLEEIGAPLAVGAKLLLQECLARLVILKNAPE